MLIMTRQKNRMMEKMEKEEEEEDTRNALYFLILSIKRDMAADRHGLTAQRLKELPMRQVLPLS